MDNFDDFLRAEFRRIEESRLDEYGNREALKTAMSKGISDLVGKVSNSAKGSSNLKAQVQKIVQEFKIYCGEQQLPYKYITLEDFADFVISKMGYDESAFDYFAYGKKVGESQLQSSIDAVVGRIKAGAKDSQGDDDDQDQPVDRRKTPVTEEEMDWFKELENNGSEEDKIAVSKSLWKLTRERPSLLRHFNPIADIIGKKMTAKQLYQVSTVAAKVLLKSAGISGGASGGKGGKEGKEGKDDGGLDEGSDVLPTNKDLKDGYRSKAFQAIVDEGLSMAQFKAIGNAVAQSFLKDDPAETKRMQNAVLSKLNRFSPKECVRLTRRMLVFWAFNKNNREGLDELIKLMNDDMQTRWEDTIEKALLTLAAGNTQTGRNYDATEVNKLLFRVVNRPEQTRQMLAIMIYCLYARL